MARATSLVLLLCLLNTRALLCVFKLHFIARKEEEKLNKKGHKENETKGQRITLGYEIMTPESIISITQILLFSLPFLLSLSYREGKYLIRAVSLRLHGGRYKTRSLEDGAGVP